MTARNKRPVCIASGLNPDSTGQNCRNIVRVHVSYRAVLRARAFRPCCARPCSRRRRSRENSGSRHRPGRRCCGSCRRRGCEGGDGQGEFSRVRCVSRTGRLLQLRHRPPSGQHRISLPLKRQWAGQKLSQDRPGRLNCSTLYLCRPLSRPALGPVCFQMNARPVEDVDPVRAGEGDTGSVDCCGDEGYARIGVDAASIRRDLRRAGADR